MEKLLVNCEGFDLGRFIIPKFELYEGELITIYLYNGAHFYDLSMELVDIFTGKIKHDAVKIDEPLIYAKHFKENSLRRIFFPTTISWYIKSEKIKKQDIIKKIYGIESEMCKLEPNTKIKMLEQTERKLLSLYSVLNRTNKIIFDLVAQSPQGAIKTLEIVKSELGKTGAAILLDGYEDENIKKESSKWIKIEIKE